MTPATTRLGAADALAAVLALENAALARNDFAAAGALLARKQEAAALFAASWRGAARPFGGPGPAMRELAGLVDDNRRLLDQAMAVQRQVIGTVVRAAAAGTGAPLGRYGRSGVPVQGPAGRALLSRA